MSSILLPIAIGALILLILYTYFLFCSHLVYHWYVTLDVCKNWFGGFLCVHNFVYAVLNSISLYVSFCILTLRFIPI